MGYQPGSSGDSPDSQRRAIIAAALNVAVGPVTVAGTFDHVRIARPRDVFSELVLKALNIFYKENL
tara:strand:+ start:580 stop:777 length:198 start_codon:yes stop_codon:yes gene_type:complete